MYDSTATIGNTTNGKAPNVIGSFGFVGGSNGRVYPRNLSGAFSSDNVTGGAHVTSGGTATTVTEKFDFNAHKVSAVYDDNATGITPAGIYTLLCIKY